MKVADLIDQLKEMIRFDEAIKDRTVLIAASGIEPGFSGTAVQEVAAVATPLDGPGDLKGDDLPIVVLMGGRRVK